MDCLKYIWGILGFARRGKKKKKSATGQGYKCLFQLIFGVQINTLRSHMTLINP